MEKRCVIITVICVVLIMICISCSPSSAEYTGYIDITQEYEQQQEIKVHAHEMAEHARALKIPEDDNIIVTAGKLWGEADEMQKALLMLSTYTTADEYYLSKTMYAEARGSNDYELSKVAWCILNRVDINGSTIQAVVTAPYQFAYSVYKDGDTYLYMAKDVLLRYCMEKCGIEDCGRTLPEDYVQFRGDGRINHYYKSYSDATRGVNEYTNWLVSPYGA